MAPWVDPQDEERASVGDFFDFDIDPLLADRTAGITIFYSTDDDAAIIKSVEKIESTIPGITMRQFNDKGHFVLGSMHTEAFPELLEIL